MRILVLGGGGREHAMAWRFCRDGHQVWAAPGNAGTASVDGARNLALDVGDGPAAAVQACRDLGIELVVPGSEAFLEAGVADALAEAQIPCFGPSRSAARIETSKAFSKELFLAEDVPTARGAAFADPAEAVAYAVKELGGRVAVKADGLAAGKGVVLAHNPEEAEAEILRMMRGDTVGDAGRRVVLEELLEGEELSFTALTDGGDHLLLPSSQDHKPRDEGNRGPNTGGMGACSPAPALTSELSREVVDRVLRPVLRAMARGGAPYLGFLYVGLMLCRDGVRVIEINCRLGDPETQVLLPRLDGLDLAGACALCAKGPGSIAGILRDGSADAEWAGKVDGDRLLETPQACVGTVVAAAGYPGAVEKGAPMQVPEPGAGQQLFLAGVSQDPSGGLRTAGGRVACALGMGDSLAEAQRVSLDLAEQVRFDGAFFRRDIGWQSIAHQDQENGA